MSSKSLTKEFVLSNANGLHIRPASVFVQVAMQFEADILVENLDSQQQSDGKSVMGMLMLAAPQGTRMRLTITGSDRDAALSALTDLIARDFDEE